MLLLLGLAPASATPPSDRVAVLRRGVNITNWFRFPPSLSPAALRGYMGDAAMADLRRAGFTFVRLAVQPEILLTASGAVDAQRIGLVTEAVARFERSGLAVLVELHPVTWQLEQSAGDRGKLLLVWRALAPALSRLDARLTFPAVVNEPVFKQDPAAWETLQNNALATIRAALPNNTVILTGNEWGSLDGLLRLHPAHDGNVVYSFHFYEPTLLTTLGAYQSGLDQTALATLPFPVTDPGACAGIAAAEPTKGAIRYYCGQHWDVDRLTARIAQAGEWARRNAVIVLAGEFGARDRLNRPARLAWLRAARNGFEGSGMGWALWGYEDSFGFAVPRPPGARPALNPAVLDALGLAAPGSTASK